MRNPQKPLCHPLRVARRNVERGLEHCDCVIRSHLSAVWRVVKAKRSRIAEVAQVSGQRHRPKQRSIRPEREPTPNGRNRSATSGRARCRPLRCTGAGDAVRPAGTLSVVGSTQYAPDFNATPALAGVRTSMPSRSVGASPPKRLSQPADVREDASHLSPMPRDERDQFHWNAKAVGTRYAQFVKACICCRYNWL